MQISGTAIENSIVISHKIKAIIHSVIPLLIIGPEVLKSDSVPDICIFMHTATLFIIDKIRNQLKCPKDEWIEKMWYIYIVEYYLHFKKNILLLVKT